METRTVVSYEATTKAGKEMAWEGDTAVMELRKWASKDGSGDKEQMDWTKYRRGFTWYDGADVENFGSYKLPHHRVIDGQLVVVWRGVVAAMSALNGGRGGVDIPEDEKSGCHSHLAKHYEQFDEVPPELKKMADSFFSDIVKNRKPYQDNRGQ